MCAAAGTNRSDSILALMLSRHHIGLALDLREVLNQPASKFTVGIRQGSVLDEVHLVSIELGSLAVEFELHVEDRLPDMLVPDFGIPSFQRLGVVLDGYNTARRVVVLIMIRADEISDPERGELFGELIPTRLEGGDLLIIGLVLFAQEEEALLDLFKLRLEHGIVGSHPDLSGGLQRIGQISIASPADGISPSARSSGQMPEPCRRLRAGQGVQLNLARPVISTDARSLMCLGSTRRPRQNRMWAYRSSHGPVRRARNAVEPTSFNYAGKAPMPPTEDESRLATLADLSQLVYQCTAIANSATAAVNAGCVTADFQAIREPLYGAADLIGQAVQIAKGGREVVVERRDSRDPLSTPVRISWA